jgi:hypothetical protein
LVQAHVDKAGFNVMGAPAIPLVAGETDPAGAGKDHASSSTAENIEKFMVFMIFIRFAI